MQHFQRCILRNTASPEDQLFSHAATMALLWLFEVLYTLLAEVLEKVEWDKSWNHLVSQQLVAQQIFCNSVLFIPGWGKGLGVAFGALGLSLTQTIFQGSLEHPKAFYD